MRKFIISEETLRKFLLSNIILAANSWEWYSDSIWNLLNEENPNSIEELTEKDLELMIESKTITLFED